MVESIVYAFGDGYIDSVDNFNWYSWDHNRDLIHTEFQHLIE